MFPVVDFIQKHHLLSPAEKYLVALSGGADSVALLLILRQLGYQIEAVHCNFHLRGEESDRDENFCRTLCQKRQIPFHIAHFDTKEYAALHHVSMEMAARELRYAYFSQLASDIGADGVCVAHHRDDSVETVLLNLIRGTGIGGLKGIQPRNGIIIRPLLCLTRKEIEHYLEQQRQDYVTDSTNLTDEVTRNKIRHQVLPAMLQVNPSVVQSIDTTAHWIAEAAKALDAAMKEKAQKVVFLKRLLDGEEVIGIPRQQMDTEYFLFYLLNPCGFRPEQITSIYEQMQSLATGSLFESPTHQLLIDRDLLLLRKKIKENSTPLIIPETGVYLYGDHLRLMVKKNEGGRLADYPYQRADWACLDAEQVCFPLTVRRVRQGDWFIPFGMKGKKLVSDDMTDRKMSLFEKQAQLVIVDARDRIVWLVNQRPDNRFRVTEATRCMLTIHCETVTLG